MANDDPKKPATPPQDRSPEELKNPAPGCEAWEALAAEFQDPNPGAGASRGAGSPPAAMPFVRARGRKKPARPGVAAFLEARPAPPDDLFEAILAATSGTSLSPAEASSGALQPQFSLPTAAARAADGPGYRSRLVMTAAMAYLFARRHNPPGERLHPLNACRIPPSRILGPRQSSSR